MKNQDYWFPWSPALFKRDTMHLSNDQELIYRRLIDFYMEVSKGPLEDNDQALAKIAGFPLSEFTPHSEVVRKFFRKCNKNKNPAASGYLMLTRCEAILADQAERTKIYRDNGKKGGRKKDNENNGKKAKPKQTASTIHRQDIEDTIVSSPPSPKDDIAAAFAMFNETAERAGIPKAQRLNKTREGRISSRLRDCGGLEGWAAAMAKLEASDFCTGRKTDFKASIDFILQESSFTKLMEGNYDNGQRGTTSQARGGLNDRTVEGFSRAAVIHARNKQRGPVQAGAADNPGDLFAETAGRRSPD